MSGERVLVSPLVQAPRRVCPDFLRLRLSERRLLLVAGDLLCLSLALWAALWVRLPVWDGPGRFLVGHLRPLWWPLLWGLWLPLAIIVGVYDLKRAALVAPSVVYTSACAGVVTFVYLVVPVISAPLTRSRTGWFVFALLAMGGVATWRVIYARLLAQPTFARRVLVVGAGRAGAALAQALDRLGHPDGFSLLGFVDDNPRLWGQKVAQRPVLGPSEQLPDLLRELRPDAIVVAITDVRSIRPQLLDALVRCWEQGVEVKPMPLFYEELTGSVPVEHIGQNLFALADGNDGALLRLWDAARRLLDILISVVGLLVLLALLPFIALAIVLDSPGPILYCQERVGCHGRVFRICKFRSMVPDAERNGPQWAAEQDPRITRVGRWLRKSRLDELPQLWNVLRGDMSLIGPRPERPEFVRELESKLPYYGIRHAIRPGLTGWAQVRYRYGNSLTDALIKLQYDLYYLKHRGPVLDLLILLHTVRVVLQMGGH